ncbi:hypothetical protein B0H17DRAFT_951898, partial [Mycena rosella]
MSNTQPLQPVPTPSPSAAGITAVPSVNLAPSSVSGSGTGSELPPNPSPTAVPAAPAPTPVPAAPPSPPPGPSGDDNEDEENWEDEDTESGVPRPRPGVSSWSERNPNRPIIPLRTGRRKQNADTRATAKKKRLESKRKDFEFQADIDAINEARNRLAEEVAAKHNVKVDLVLRRLMSRSSFKACRKVNRFNAKVHHLAKRMKKAGVHLSFQELTRRVLDDPEFQNLSQAEEAAMVTELPQDRAVKSTGARATNNAAAADAQFTIAMIAEEMNALAERTSMAGFAIFSRGHVHDTTIPTELESWDALKFIEDILRLDPRDIAAQFELWAVAREKVDTLRSMRKEFTKYISTGLGDTTKKKKISMNYLQYRKAIVLKYGVVLKGYPLEGNLVNPNNINDIESITKVRDALKSGECFWYRMSPREREIEKEEYSHLVEEGAIQEHTRKVRSD